MSDAVFAARLVVLLAAGCQPVPQPDGPRPPQDAATTVPVEPGACEAACDAYRRLGCPEGEPTPRGSSCEQVCWSVADGGINLAPDPACFRGASSCDEALRCSGE